MTFEVILFLATVIAPIIFWLWFFRRQDRAEPEPKKLLIKVFLFGIVAAIFASIANNVSALMLFPTDWEKMTSEGFLDSAEDVSIGMILIFFLAGPIEESIKYFILKKAVYLKTEFNQIADGIIYGTTIALGFAFIENIDYFISFLGLTKEELVLSAAGRGLTTTLIHVISTGIMGFYLGKAKFSRGNRKAILRKGLIIAATIHGLYNLFIFTPLVLIIFPILLAVIIILVGKLKKTESQLVWKLITPKDRRTKKPQN